MSSDVSAPPRLPALDALRAAGAAAVVGVHVGFATGWGAGPWGGLVVRLDVGVAVFFVLSGFVLFRPFAWACAHGDHRPGVGGYLWRRALRILPAYWLTVAVCLLVLPNNAGLSWVEWLRYATFTQFYDRGHIHDALGHTWSLAVEAAFYLLLPLLAVLALGSRWRPRRTVAILCAGGGVVTAGWFAAMAAGRLDMGLHTMWLPSFAGWFAAGMAMATLRVAMETGGRSVLAEAAKAPLTWWALAAGLFVIAATPLTGPRDLAEPTPGQFATKVLLFLGVSVAIVLPVAFAGPGRLTSTLSAPVARWLGMVSYGLFLWHPLVLALLHPAMTSETFGGALRVYLLTVAGALVLATLSWYGLEQPLQEFGRRFTRTARAGGQSPSPSGDAGLPGPGMTEAGPAAEEPATAEPAAAAWAVDAGAAEARAADAGAADAGAADAGAADAGAADAGAAEAGAVDAPTAGVGAAGARPADRAGPGANGSVPSQSAANAASPAS